MSERYSKLFTLPENLYATGSPVVIAAGALLKDNQTGKVLTQLKLRNIGKKTIKAATVFVEPLDTVGKPLGAPVTYQYLDLHADRDADFGQKAPIALPDSATRSFVVSVVQVIFADNSIWNDDSPAWKPLNRPKSLDALGDSELTKQFRIEYGGGCENLLLEQKDLWHCFCGAVNRQEEANCHKCGKALVELQSIDLDAIRQKKDERIAKEQAKAEAARIKAKQEAEIAAARAKKIGKIAAVVTAIVSVVVIVSSLFTQIVIPAREYKKAVSYMENENYEEAVVLFKELDDYKDSAQKAQACSELAIIEKAYNEAIGLMLNGQYDDAADVFDEIGVYKDSAEKAAECISLKYNAIYDEAALLESTGNLVEAAMMFGKLKSYQDAQVRSFSLWDEIAVRKTMAFCIQNDDISIGVKADGSLITSAFWKSKVASEIEGWTNIVDIAVLGSYALGLKNDGTVVIAGENVPDNLKQAISAWENVVAISAGTTQAVGLKSDGTLCVVDTELLSAGEQEYAETASWSEIVDISVGAEYIVGRRADGTVVACGDNSCGQCNVTGWNNVVAISASGVCTLGVKSDGSVLVTGGSNAWGKNLSEISTWTDIVAVSAGYGRIAGLKANGTVVTTQTIHFGEYDLSSWTNIVAISTSIDSVYGLRSDGTVVHYYNVWGYDVDPCRVCWENIKLP